MIMTHDRVRQLVNLVRAYDKALHRHDDANVVFLGQLLVEYQELVQVQVVDQVQLQSEIYRAAQMLEDCVTLVPVGSRRVCFVNGRPISGPLRRCSRVEGLAKNWRQPIFRVSE